METITHQWAEDEFGGARLGDERRVARLVAVAAQVLRNPSGKITKVFGTEAEREGAFRLVENEAVDTREIALAAHLSCARRGSGEPFVFVAVDETSLRFIDRTGQKRLGIVGARRVGATGLQVMTAMAISAEGLPLGLCGQEIWAREKRSKGKRKHDKRRVEQKETQRWLDVMSQARDVFEEEAHGTRTWFQLDRGGDAWPVLMEGLNAGQLFTVRAAYDRRLRGAEEEPRRHLWAELKSQSVLGEYELEVPARPARRANWHQRSIAARRGRTATMQLRTCEVTVDLLDERTSERHPATLFAVLAREAECSAQADEAIEWMLLTSHPVRTLADAKLVLWGYSHRWRIEEFHKAWKSGTCRVEDSQLRDRTHLQRWVTILASVAARAVRLTYLARSKPAAPATIELTEFEIEATLLANKRPRTAHGSIPAIAEMVMLLAKIGGYTGRSSGGPPGAIVITRGLQKIDLLADLLSVGVVKRTDQ